MTQISDRRVENWSLRSLFAIDLLSNSFAVLQKLTKNKKPCWVPSDSFGINKLTNYEFYSKKAMLIASIGLVVVQIPMIFLPYEATVWTYAALRFCSAMFSISGELNHKKTFFILSWISYTEPTVNKVLFVYFPFNNNSPIFFGKTC